MTARKVRSREELVKIERVIIGDAGYIVGADLDSGAQLCFMGEEQYTAYSLLSKSKAPIALKYPVKIRVADKRYVYSRKCIVDKVTIEVGNDLVTLHNVVIYIVEGPWDDVLIGWPVLTALGLTPEQNIHKWAGKCVDMLKHDQQLIGVDQDSILKKKDVPLEDAISKLSRHVPEILRACQLGRISATRASVMLDKLANYWDLQTQGDSGFVIMNGTESDNLPTNPTYEFGCFSYRTTYPNFSMRYEDESGWACRFTSLPNSTEKTTADSGGDVLKKKLRNVELSDVCRLIKAYRLWYKKLVVRYADGAVIRKNEELDTDSTFDEVGIGDRPDPVDFETFLQAELKLASEQGISPVHLKRLESILRRYKRILIHNFEDCEISDLTPMSPKLKEGVEPCISKPRRMSLEQLTWLEGHINQMVKLGMLRRVKNPVWGVPVFVVAKPGNKGWRMVADFRAINSRSQPSSLPMPLLEQLLDCTAGAKFFASLDNMKGFNLLPTSRSDIFTLVTPFGCYEMLVAPQGYLNSPQVYQDRIANEVLQDLHGKICANWVDDCLVFGNTVDEFLDRLTLILERYEKYNVKLNFAKCQFFRRKIVWCGREFTEEGYSFDPKYYDKVLAIPTPELATELHSFVHSLQWIQTTLVPFGLLEAKGVLQDFLQKIFMIKTPKSTSKNKPAGQKKRYLAGVKLIDFGWSQREQEAFEKCKQIIHKAIRLAVPDPTQELCLFTDASSFGCSIIVTQSPAEELLKPLREQQHAIVFLTTHKWTEAESRWHVSSQEAYPVIFALKRLDYLFAGRKLNIFMDHRNLEYILNPQKETSKTTLMRLQRWSLIIQSYQYCIRHISGEDNFLADLFSRWGVKQQRKVSANTSRILRRLEAYNQPGEKNKPVDIGQSRRKNLKLLDPEEIQEKEPLKDITPEDKFEVKVQLPTHCERTELKQSLFDQVISRVDPKRNVQGDLIHVPTLEEIKFAQLQTKANIPTNSIEEDGIIKVGGKIWIPDSLLPLLVAVMHSEYGHPGANTLAKILKRSFYSNKIYRYCKDLNQFCLNCTGEHQSRTIKRRLGQQFYATKRNGVLHLDFLYIRAKEYVLAIRDDLSGKTEFIACNTADAIVAADGILWWRSRYGLRMDTIIVTDGGSHFANSLVAELTHKLRIRHHITVAYSPWSNGKAERLNREFLKVLRVMLSELSLESKYWTLVLSQVQFKLNNTPRKRLNDKTSDEIFLVQAETGPLDLYVIQPEGYNVESIPRDSRIIQESFEKLYDIMEATHKGVIDVQARLRLNRKHKQDSMGLEHVQYAIGDYVLVSRATRKSDKLQLQWLGPFQIVDTLSPWVYQVQSLLTGKVKNVHVVRLRLYANKYLAITEDVIHQLIRDTKGFEIDTILDCRWNSNASQYELKCRWWGFDKTADSWIEFDKAVSQNPDKVDRYLLTANPSNTVKLLCQKRDLQV